jgi:hypothetical protein
LGFLVQLLLIYAQNTDSAGPLPHGVPTTGRQMTRRRQGWHFDPLSFWIFVQKPKNPQPKPPPHLGRYLCVTQKPLTEDENPFFTPLKSSKIYQFLPKTQKTQKPKTQNPKVTTQAK